MNSDFANSSVDKCYIVQLPKINNRAGNLTALNNFEEVPFAIERVYYLYDIPGGETRGGHAHYDLWQLLIAASGSFDVILDDGKNKKTISLNRPNFGLLITPGIWRELVDFSSGSICLVLASEGYSEADYIRNYDEFIKTRINVY
jgi:hypothetical protein